jgi:hypothetical protein
MLSVARRVIAVDRIASVITGVIVVGILADADLLGASVITIVIVIGILVGAEVQIAAVIARMILIVVHTLFQHSAASHVAHVVARIYDYGYVRQYDSLCIFHIA